MGVTINVDYDTFPKQGTFLGKKVSVCFFYNTDQIIQGEIVRDDIEYPFQTIIKLEDNRYILATECQFAPNQ